MKRLPRSIGRAVIMMAGGVFLSAGCDRAEPQPAPAVRDLSVPALSLDDFQEPVAEAIQQARQNLLRDTNNGKAWFLFAATLDAHKLYDEAELSYDNATTLDPTDRFALYNYAMMLEARGDRIDEAIEMFRRVSASMTDYAPVWYHQGRLLRQQGRYEEARQMLSRALSMYPQLPALHYDQGQTLMALGHTDQALSHLEQAAHLMPEDSAIHAALSRAYLKLGDTDRAKREAELAGGTSLTLSIPDPVRRAVKSLAMDSFSCLRRGSRTMDEGNHAEAIADLQRAARYLTKNASVHLRLGICHYTIKQYEASKTYLQRTIELRDSMAQPYQILGRIDVEERRYEQAANMFRNAISLEPDNAEHCELLGDVLEKLGRRGEAIALYRQALAIDPNASVAPERLLALRAAPR